MTRTTLALTSMTSLFALALAGCHGHREPLEAAPAGTYLGPSEEADYERPSSAAPTADDAAAGELAESQGRMQDRPGLGTEWGEQRYSPVRSARFSRADDEPMTIARIYYNDPEGVRAMTRGRFLSTDDCVVSVERGALTVSLEDASGRPLSAAHAGGRFYAVGRVGDRYAIRVHNHTPYRVEAVATVDGLDVIDGEDGDLDKRGYLIGPHSDLRIEGFRDSNETVAAFRFGSVRDSYATRTGRGRDVGVIGVAFFSEQGDDWHGPAPYWSESEIYRRETADPFPSRFAKPPPPRW